jgi:putative radical SAM enzyme (TIGR03279 family)
MGKNLQYTLLCKEIASGGDMSTVIRSIDRRSPAERAGVRAGEKLLSIGGHGIEDVLDYRFFGYDPDPTLELEAPDGARRTVQVKKPEAEELGLNFETYLMDEPRPCSNHCLFCFVDQMAPGCRDTLYFKDDDARLSFLMGNYITLTNLSPREVQRIIDLRISPINVSVHATDPRLRSILLGNRAGGESLEAMRRFGAAGIVMNGQIVLCPGYNDGDQLQRTMEDMAAWGFASCSVVPVGLTRFREGLSKLRPVDRETANQVIDQVDAFGEVCLERYGTRMFFCSDEMYLRAGRALPGEDYYEDYVQIENGVGMLRSLVSEFEAGLRLEDGPIEAPPFTIATGVSARPFLQELADKAREKTGVSGQVVAIVNDFFGHTIDVAGLVTGGDLIAQLKGRDLGARLLIPVNMLRHGGDVFLDDLHVGDVEAALGVPVTVVEQDGFDLLDAMLDRK